VYKNKKNADVTTVNSFKQYVGEYVLEEAGMTIKIYTKK